MRGRDENGSFPLGSRGCTVSENGDKQKKNQRGNVLKSKFRMPTMEDMIKALAYIGTMQMMRTIVREYAVFILCVEVCLGYSSVGFTD